jgi:anti-sigma factor RsiW
MSTDDTMLDDLLGAYALDAVEPDEAVVVEEYLERAPRAADEVARLRNAAAWIGATEALAPPTELHDAVLEAVRSRPRTTSLGRSAPNDPFLAPT